MGELMKPKNRSGSGRNSGRDLPGPNGRRLTWYCDSHMTYNQCRNYLLTETGDASAASKFFSKFSEFDYIQLVRGNTGIHNLYQMGPYTRGWCSCDFSGFGSCAGGGT